MPAAAAHHSLARGAATIAYRRSEGTTPGVIFLGGFHSEMNGNKATALESWAGAKGCAYVRFDYQGHGASSGRFEDGAIGTWADDALAVLDGATQGPQVLVGSSMGGWIALLLALKRPERVAALVGVAAAPDFTEDLILPRLDETARAAVFRDGVWHRPSAYGSDPYPITRRLIEEARGHLLLRGPIPVRCPVRLIHGMRDPDVPWRTSLRLIECLEGDDARLTLVKDGDHRLSRPEDLILLERTIGTVLDEVQESSR